MKWKHKKDVKDDQKEPKRPNDMAVMIYLDNVAWGIEPNFCNIFQTLPGL